MNHGHDDVCRRRAAVETAREGRAAVLSAAAMESLGLDGGEVTDAVPSPVVE